MIQGRGNSGQAGTSTGPVVIVIDNKQQIVVASEEEIRESVRWEIDETLNAQIEDLIIMDLDI